MPTLSDPIKLGAILGRPFIANSDLVERLARGDALARDEQATWYSQEAEGDVDSPRVAA